MNALLFGHKRFVRRPHIAKLALQTLKKTCNCGGYKQTKYSTGTDEKASL